MIMCIFAMTAASAQINSVAIVGTAVGGWPGEAGNPGPEDLHQLTKVDADNWKIEGLTITAGPCKLRANNAWGGAGFEWAGAFPSAAGTSSGDILVTIAGVYTVTLNTATNVYNFVAGVPIPVVKLVGTAVQGGSVDISATSPTTFQAKLNLLDGNAQFDVDGVLLSDSAFPSGIAGEGLPSIAVSAGEWIVKYNSETGEYSFDVAPAPIVGITGAAGPGWGNDYEFTTTDGINYTLLGGVFVEGGMLFRLDKSYTVKFGGEADGLDIFATPSGTLTEGGKDLVVSAVTAGTYDITFNRLTKEYTTALSLSTKGFSTANFKVSPNPTTNNWNFTTANDSIESIQILDVLGKNVMSISPRSNTANVDASSLTRGIYFAKVATAKATQTLKLMKN